MILNLLKLSDVKIITLFLISIVLVILLLLVVFGNIDYIFKIFSLGHNSKAVIVNIDDDINQEFYHYPNSAVLWVMIPSWGESLELADDFKDDLVEKGYSYLRYNFPVDILSSDYKLTKDNFDKINELIISDIKNKKEEYNFSEINIIGVSIGTSNLFTVVNNSEISFNKVVAVVPGNSLAECMWKGISTKNIRKTYEENGIELDFLEKEWSNFSPVNNLNNLDVKTNQIYVYLSKADKIIPYECGIKLIDKMREDNIKFILKENKYLGHYGTVYNAYFKPEFLDEDKKVDPLTSKESNFIF